jgi:hypothetical protein
MPSGPLQLVWLPVSRVIADVIAINLSPASPYSCQYCREIKRDYLHTGQVPASLPAGGRLSPTLTGGPARRRACPTRSLADPQSARRALPRIGADRGSDGSSLIVSVGAVSRKSQYPVAGMAARRRTGRPRPICDNGWPPWNVRSAVPRRPKVYIAGYFRRHPTLR